MRLTVEEFLKLRKLEDAGYWIYLDGSKIVGLHYCMESDAERDEFVLSPGVTDARELCCNFVFEDDRYGTVQCLSEYAKGSWEVFSVQQVLDWRNLNVESDRTSV